MHRNFKMGFLTAFSFALVNSEHPVKDVQPSHLDHVAAALAGVEEQRECEPRLRANRMPLLEASDMILRPCLIAGGLGLLAGDAERRILRDPAFLDRPFEHGAKG